MLDPWSLELVGKTMSTAVLPVIYCHEWVESVLPLIAFYWNKWWPWRLNFLFSGRLSLLVPPSPAGLRPVFGSQRSVLPAEGGVMYIWWAGGRDPLESLGCSRTKGLARVSCCLMTLPPLLFSCGRAGEPRPGYRGNMSGVTLGFSFRNTGRVHLTSMSSPSWASWSQEHWTNWDKIHVVLDERFTEFLWSNFVKQCKLKLISFLLYVDNIYSINRDQQEETN